MLAYERNGYDFIISAPLSLSTLRWVIRNVLAVLVPILDLPRASGLPSRLRQEESFPMPSPKLSLCAPVERRIVG
jgi:hypothetical protein